MKQITRIDNADKINYYTNGLKPAIKIKVKYWVPVILAETIEIAIQYNSIM